MGGDVGRETGQSRTEPADGDSEIVRGQTKLVLASTLAALAAATSNSANGMGAWTTLGLRTCVLPDCLFAPPPAYEKS
jgi:hypothetical protein